jgi:hypothetical protein
LQQDEGTEKRDGAGGGKNHRDDQARIALLDVAPTDHLDQCLAA